MRGLKVIRYCTIYNTTCDVEGYYMLETSYPEPTDTFFNEKCEEINVTDVKDITVSLIQKDLLGSVQYGADPYRQTKVACIKTNDKLNVGDIIYVDIIGT